jgi:hypothetical protein
MKQEEFEMIAEKNPQMEKAVAVLMDLSADEQTRLLEESREKYRRDWAARMRGAQEKGSSQRALEDATRLKKLGVPLDTIVQGTGLSPEEVSAL